MTGPCSTLQFGHVQYSPDESLQVGTSYREPENRHEHLYIVVVCPLGVGTTLLDIRFFLASLRVPSHGTGF